MDNIREPEHQGNIHSQREGRFSLIDALERDRGGTPDTTIERITERAQTQAKRRALHCATYTTSVDGLKILNNDLVLFPGGLHLPDESEIGSVFIENYSGCSLNLFEGSGSVGRIVGIVPPGAYRIIAVSDAISSISVVIDKAEPKDQGLVIVVLFTHKWAPKQGGIYVAQSTTPTPPSKTTTPAFGASITDANGTIYAPPTGKLHLSYASITVLNPLTTGEAIALQGDGNNLLMITEGNTQAQASFPSPYIVAATLSVSYGTTPFQNVYWVFSGYTG